MKIALVHDDLIQHGGAERLFKTMAEIWPQAPVFTSMMAGKWKMLDTKWKISTSFMQSLPFKKELYRIYFPLYPLAFESFDFTDSEIVLSSSTRFAHGIITRPETTHICYMNTPGRMFWEPQSYFQSRPWLRKVLASFLSYLRCWDYSAAQRVDYFIANSKSVQAKIKKYYGRDSEVIYPFVELERFAKSATRHPLSVDLDGNVPDYESQVTDNEYFLVVSRLTSWKRVDLVIEAANKLKIPLVIIGSGPDEERLRKMAGPKVKLLGRLSDEDVVRYFQLARALIFPQREDFGITPLEAMALGKPVLAYKAGGALETVLPGETGEFFYPQTGDALAKALSDFRPERYDPQTCRKQAEKFSRRRFVESLKNTVARISESKLL